jgi:hypothetical protein
VYWAAQVSVDPAARIPAPVNGRHEVAVVDAMAERNLLRESFFESLIFNPLVLVYPRRQIDAALTRSRPSSWHGL